MAASVHSGSGAPNPDPWDDEAPPALTAEINITPLVDVILVVLVLLLVSSSAAVDASRDGRLSVSLPTAGEASDREAESSILVIGMTDAGSLYLDGDPVPLDSLAKALQDRSRQQQAFTVIVDADGSIAHRDVVRVLDAIKAAGFESVEIGATSTIP